MCTTLTGSNSYPLRDKSPPPFGRKTFNPRKIRLFGALYSFFSSRSRPFPRLEVRKYNTGARFQGCSTSRPPFFGLFRSPWHAVAFPDIIPTYSDNRKKLRRITPTGSQANGREQARRPIPEPLKYCFCSLVLSSHPV